MPISENFPEGLKPIGKINHSDGQYVMPRPRPSQQPTRSGSFDLGDELAQGVAGIAKKHHRLRIVEELVVDPRKARPQAPLEDEDGGRLVGIEDRHAIDRAAG